MNEDTFYVLMMVGWRQYNDETYFRTEDNGGKPEKVFFCQKRAEQEAVNLNVKEFQKLFKTGEITNYGYNAENVFKHNEFYVTFKQDSVLKNDDNDKWSLSKSKDPVKKKIGKAVEYLKKELPDDFLKAVFGDHCEVIAQPDKFIVKSYKHD